MVTKMNSTPNPWKRITTYEEWVKVLLVKEECDTFSLD
jgi:hypothetical protein